jgi:hypothetical protein
VLAARRLVEELDAANLVGVVVGFLVLHAP